MKNKLAPLFKKRLTKLQAALKASQALLLSNAYDIQYFAGFKTLVTEEREALLLVAQNQVILFHASFSPVDKLPFIFNVDSCKTVKVKEVLLERKKQLKLKNILVDKSSLFADEHEVLQTMAGLSLGKLDRNLVWQLRTIKDKQELALIRQASHMANKTMTKLAKQLKVGVTEQEIANFIASDLLKNGSENLAFPTIVAFGDHSALPHHQPTTRKLKKEMPVLIDLGATYQSYRSDMTRSWWFGDKPSAKFKAVEQVVQQAYQAVADKLQNRNKEILAKDLDQAARSTITQAGYGKQFIHTTGHGIGLDIHENLSLNWKNNTPIIPNMVITIEPGIYLPGKFGYRYENTVLVTEEGLKEFTN